MELVREVTDGPLCPNGVVDPIHEAHRLRVRMLDAFYEASKPYAVEDAGQDEPLDVVYSAVAYGPSSDDRMRLYWHTDSIIRGRGIDYIEAYWYRCGVCGLTLPASRQEVRR